MKPDVYLVRCPPSYDATPWAAEGRVRQAMGRLWAAMGLDLQNPFRDFLRAGDRAVIKPNWVLHVNLSGQGLDCLITHVSLIYCMMEWCAVAMGGQGQVVVGDCPLQGCRFDRLLESIGMRGILDAFSQRYPRVRVEVADWRLTVLEQPAGDKDHGTCGHQVSRDVAADLAGNYCELDAGRNSFLEDIVEYADRFRVTMYKPSLLRQHHRPGVHRYLIRKDVLEADFLINLPKMKTHEKAGLTGALKNLVGINGHKEYLPHHIKGAYFAGGDCYAHHNWFAAWAEEIYDRWWETYGDLTRGRRWSSEKAYLLLKIAARLTSPDHIAPGSRPGN